MLRRPMQNAKMVRAIRRSHSGTRFCAQRALTRWKGYSTCRPAGESVTPEIIEAPVMLTTNFAGREQLITMHMVVSLYMYSTGYCTETGPSHFLPRSGSSLRCLAQRA